MNNDYKIEHDGSFYHLYHNEDGEWIKYPVGSIKKSTMYEQYLRIVDYNEGPWK